MYLTGKCTLMTKTLFCNIDNNVTQDSINCELHKIFEWLGTNILALVFVPW